MKSAAHHITALLLCFLMGPKILSAEDAPKTLTMVGDEWCPYNCAPGNDQPGYLVEVLQEAFGAAGVHVEYRLMPWQRAILSVEKGQDDILVGAVRGNKGNNIIGATPLGRDTTVLVVRRGEAFVYRSPQDLNGKSLGVIGAYTYDNNGALDQYFAGRKATGQDINVLMQDQARYSLFEMLLLGRIDAFPGNLYVLRATAGELGINEKIDIVTTGEGDEIFAAFTPNEEGKRNLAAFESGLKNLKESGRYQTILERYGLNQ